MGLLNSVGIGIGAAANAAQPFILNMQQAEIQKLRDDRMAEIAKGAAKYASDLSLANEETIAGRNIKREEDKYNLGVTRAPAELDRKIKEGGLLSAAKRDSENTPEAIASDAARAKAIAQAQHIDSPDLNAGLRAVQTDLAKLQLSRAQEEAKIPAAVNKTLDSLNKRADILTTATARSDFDPTTDNGKKTIADLESVHKQYADTVKPYLPKTEAPPPPPKTLPTDQDISGLVARASNPAAIAAFNSRFGEGAAEKYLPKKPGGAKVDTAPDQRFRNLSENENIRRAGGLFLKDVGDVLSGQTRERARLEREARAKAVRGY